MPSFTEQSDQLEHKFLSSNLANCNDFSSLMATVDFPTLLLASLEVEADNVNKQ